MSRSDFDGAAPPARTIALRHPHGDLPAPLATVHFVRAEEQVPVGEDRFGSARALRPTVPGAFGIHRHLVGGRACCSATVLAGHDPRPGLGVRPRGPEPAGWRLSAGVRARKCPCPEPVRGNRSVDTAPVRNRARPGRSGARDAVTRERVGPAVAESATVGGRPLLDFRPGRVARCHQVFGHSGKQVPPQDS